MRRLAVLRLVMSNRRLRRVVLAFLGFNLADWARWLAILLYAFDRGGAVEAGVISMLQLLPATIVAPIGASLGDRFPRDRVLQLSYVLQATFMALTAVSILASGPAALVYAFAIVGACAITLTRPAHGSLLPGIARTPAELTAANAASGTMEGLGILSGQAIAGVVVGGFGAGAALLVAAAVAGLAALAASSIDVGLGEGRRPAVDEVSNRAPVRVRALLTELTAGVRAVVSLSGPRTIVLLLGAAALVWGLLDVLLVVFALELTDLGASGVGYLNAVAGIGGLIGSSLALSLAGRLRLAVPFVVALLAWGLPVLGIGLWPIGVVAAGLLVVAGAGRTVQDVIGRTLLQRATPDIVLSRVLGVVEAMFMGAFGVGGLLAAALIALLGAQGAFVVAGLLLPAATVIAWRSLRRLDAAAVVPVRELALLRGIPMFAPLAPAILERLALNLEPMRFARGAAVIRQGERGDRLFVVAEGEVQVSIDGGVVRRQGPGTEFGEIALLRDVPRTATVTALTDVEVLGLPREVFLAAVAGHRDSRVAADLVVSVRLGEVPQREV
jgi:MFS family permease